MFLLTLCINCSVFIYLFILLPCVVDSYFSLSLVCLFPCDLSLSLSLSFFALLFPQQLRLEREIWKKKSMLLYGNFDVFLVNFFLIFFNFSSNLRILSLLLLHPNLWYCLELFGLLVIARLVHFFFYFVKLNLNALSLFHSFSFIPIFICFFFLTHYALRCMHVCIIHFCSFIHSLYLSAYWVHSLFWVILALNVLNEVSAHAAGRQHTHSSCVLLHAQFTLYEDRWLYVLYVWVWLCWMRFFFSAVVIAVLFCLFGISCCCFSFKTIYFFTLLLALLIFFLFSSLSICDSLRLWVLLS